MKKYLLLLMCAISTYAFADWSRLTYSDESRVYIDKSSIKRVGNIVEVNQMFDFFNNAKSPDNAITYKSSITREAYNCKTLQSKTISFTWYAEAMGKGKVLYADKGHKDYPWEAVPKSSLSDAVRREICK